MKIISIGMDRKLFEEKSPVRDRSVEYGKSLGELHAIVFALRKLSLSNKKISGETNVYPTNSRSRLLYIWDAYKIGKKIIVGNLSDKNRTVISSQDPFETGLVAYLLARKFHLPFQIQIHTDLWSPYFKNSLINSVRLLLARFLIPHAQSLRVVSQDISSSLERNFHDLRVVPVVLPIFVDVEKIISSIPKIDLKKDFPQFKTVVLSASRLSSEKRLDVALHAFKLVLEEFPDAGFIIAGDGPERAILEGLVNDLGLSKNVVFIGWQDDLVSFYKTADLFLLTSEYEGYGMSLVEAASSGCPIVTTEVGVVRGDLFKDGLNCHICPVGDIVCLSKKISSLLADKELRKSFGSLAQDAVKKKFSSKEQYLSNYADEFKKLSQLEIFSPKFSYIEDVVRFMTKHVLLRYLISGGTAGLSLLVSLYTLNSFFGIHYLPASMMAFVVAFLVSFVLHKFWTFKSHDEKLHKQMFLYIGSTLSSLGLNTILLYIFVDFVGFPVIMSQIIVGFLVAFVTFSISRKYVFKYKK